MTVTWDDVIDLERDCRELANDDFLAEETEQEARERMTEPEVNADDAYREQRGQEARAGKRKEQR